MKGQTIEVVGYPGDKKGHLYSSSGQLHSCKKTPSGGVILYYNTDATPGNSGCPLFTKDSVSMDPGFVTANFGPSTEALTLKTSERKLIGIHNGTEK